MKRRRRQPDDEITSTPHFPGHTLESQQRGGAAQTEHASAVDRQRQPLFRHPMLDARRRQPPDLIPGLVQTLKQISLLMRGHGPAFAPIGRVESAGFDRARSVQRKVTSPGAAWTIKRVRTFAPSQFVSLWIEP